MEEKIYALIKAKAQEAGRENGACKQGYHDLLKAENIGQLCRVLEKYWGDVLGMHRKSTFAIMDELYPANKAEFNQFGIFYNEGSGFGKVIANSALVAVSGDAKVWAFGSSVVNLSEKATCYAKDTAFVHAKDYSHVHLMEESTCKAYGRSMVNAAGKSTVKAFEACTITAGDDSKVYALGWNRIMAVGNAEVYASHSYKIKTLGNAKVILKKPEEV